MHVLHRHCYSRISVAHKVEKRIEISKNEAHQLFSCTEYSKAWELKSIS